MAEAVTMENSGISSVGDVGSVSGANDAGKRRIDVVSLYPRDMNIYGDSGNVLTITKRLACYGYEPVLHSYNQGDAWPANVDIVLGGGGQDSGQKKIQDDLETRAADLRALAEDGVPMLVVCGLYQLFGKYFETLDGYRIPGIGVFDAITIGRKQRLIGNIVEDSSDFGTIIGYENHSGQTFLRGGTEPLAQVSKGEGNNLDDSTEGARVGNVIGTYLHGSLLPKNPEIADFLIHRAAERRYGAFEPVITRERGAELGELDRFTNSARKVAQARPR
jgi:CobQ-like glutamine amidotransferase family enzyme